jgi:hypothetical protein
VNRPIVLLKVLLSGVPIVKNGDRFWLDESNYFCIEAKKVDIISGQTSSTLLRVNFGDYSLKQFIDWANSFTDDEVFTAVSNRLLAEVAREQKREEHSD